MEIVNKCQKVHLLTMTYKAILETNEEVLSMKTKARELIQQYMEQDIKEQKVTYDDDIRAEADLCHECCHCCRVMVQEGKIYENRY